MRTLALGLMAALLGFGPPVLAGEGGTAQADGKSGEWVLSLQVENEFLVPGRNDDRYYTQGFQLSAVSPTESTPLDEPASRIIDPFDALKALVDGKADRPIAPFLRPDTKIRGALVFGQNIYTPEDLRRVEPDPKDRPYAGWMYVGADAIAYSPNRMDALQLQVGVVGPTALGGWAQNGWHRHVLHIDEALGWRRQLRDEPAFVLYGERRNRRGVSGDPTRLHADFITNVSFALGTVQTSVGGGGMIRLGTDLNDDFGPARIRPAPIGSSFFSRTEGVSGYVYAGADVKAVARDIFLDGNTFRDSRRVDKRPLVGEAQVGAVVRIKRLRLTYAQVWRSEEFLGQNGHSHFAAFTAGVAAAF